MTHRTAVKETKVKPVQPTTRNQIVVRQALLFGVVLGLVDFVRTLVEGPSGLTSVIPGTLGVVAFLIVAAGFVYLGFRVAAQTTRVSSSAFAGVIASLVVWACYVAGAVLVALFNQEALRRQFQTAADQAHMSIHYTPAAVFGALGVALFLAIFWGAGVGAMLGALGGVFGKRQVTRASRAALVAREDLRFRR
jgi:hypothetical protein